MDKEVQASGPAPWCRAPVRVARCHSQKGQGRREGRLARHFGGRGRQPRRVAPVGWRGLGYAPAM